MNKLNVVETFRKDEIPLRRQYPLQLLPSHPRPLPSILVFLSLLLIYFCVPFSPWLRFDYICRVPCWYISFFHFFVNFANKTFFFLSLVLWLYPGKNFLNDNYIYLSNWWSVHTHAALEIEKRKLISTHIFAPMTTTKITVVTFFIHSMSCTTLSCPVRARGERSAFFPLNWYIWNETNLCNVFHWKISVYCRCYWWWWWAGYQMISFSVSETQFLGRVFPMSAVPRWFHFPVDFIEWIFLKIDIHKTPHDDYDNDKNHTTQWIWKPSVYLIDTCLEKGFLSSDSYPAVCLEFRSLISLFCSRSIVYYELVKCFFLFRFLESCFFL